MNTYLNDDNTVYTSGIEISRCIIEIADSSVVRNAWKKRKESRGVASNIFNSGDDLPLVDVQTRSVWIIYLNTKCANNWRLGAHKRGNIFSSNVKNLFFFFLFLFFQTGTRLKHKNRRIAAGLNSYGSTRNNRETDNRHVCHLADKRIRCFLFFFLPRSQCSF